MRGYWKMKNNTKDKVFNKFFRFCRDDLVKQICNSYDESEILRGILKKAKFPQEKLTDLASKPSFEQTVYSFIEFCEETEDKVKVLNWLKSIRDDSEGIDYFRMVVDQLEELSKEKEKQPFEELIPSGEIIELPEMSTIHTRALFSLPREKTSNVIPLVERIHGRIALEKMVTKVITRKNVVVFSNSQLTGKTLYCYQLQKAFENYGGEKAEAKVFSISAAHTWRKRIQKLMDEDNDHYVYVVYAGCMHHLLEAILNDRSIISEEQKKRTLDRHSEISDYIREYNTFFDEILRMREKEKSSSVFYIIVKILDDILTKFKIAKTVALVFFFEFDDFHTLEEQCTENEKGEKVINTFLDELEKLNNENISQGGFAGCSYKFIITMRQSNTIDKRRREKPRSFNKIIFDLDFFEKADCDIFIDKYIKKYFPRYQELEMIKRMAFDATLGYPWFFYRWLKTLVFIHLNHKEMALSKIIYYINNCGVFWYFKRPFTKKFIGFLETYIESQFPLEESEESPFLNTIKHVFEQDKVKNTMEWYKDHFAYVYDQTNGMGKTQQLTDDQKQKALPFFQIGLIEYDDSNKIFKPRNPIIQSFFNPEKINDLLEV
jgi:hypothetical protein